MIFDELLMFSKAQAAAAGASTNYINFGAAQDVFRKARAQGLASSGNLYLHVIAMEGSAMTANDMTVTMQHTDNPTGAWETLATYEVPATVDLSKPGTLLCVPVPMESKTYVRLSYAFTGTVGTGSLWAGLNVSPEQSLPFYLS